MGKNINLIIREKDSEWIRREKQKRVRRKVQDSSQAHNLSQKSPGRLRMLVIYRSGPHLDHQSLDSTQESF